jgi:hypothetical protein
VYEIQGVESEATSKASEYRPTEPLCLGQANFDEINSPMPRAQNTVKSFVALHMWSLHLDLGSSIQFRKATMQKNMVLQMQVQHTFECNRQLYATQWNC